MQLTPSKQTPLMVTFLVGHHLEFDVVEGSVYDAMHAVNLGVFCQLNSLWFDSKNNQYPLYIGTQTHIAKIDNLIAQIHSPSYVTRLPRSLNDRAYWKVTEWHNNSK